MLFDVDGTLVDHDNAPREALIRWLTGSRLATEEQCKDGLVAVWDQIAERHFPAFRARQITFQEQRRRRLRDFLLHLGIQAEQLDEQALDAVFEDYLRHYEAAWRAFDDVAPACWRFVDCASPCSATATRRSRRTSCAALACTPTSRRC